MRPWMGIVVSALMVIGGAVSLCGQTQPVVVQPSAAGMSAAETEEFSKIYQRLSGLLASISLGPQKMFGEDGWGALQFAKFSAGSLDREGYEAAIVELTADGVETRIWILVGLDLGSRILWIPVEPLPEAGASQRTLGRVAGEVPQNGLVQIDPSYMTYSRLIDLPENVPPTPVIPVPLVDVVEQMASLWNAYTSFDRDGTIVLYQWSFDGDAERIRSSFSAWHTFETSGKHTVSLMVIDDRGAEASTSLDVDVITTEEYEAGCGCH